MDLEVSPEPSPGDEAALRAALEVLDRDPESRARTAWWREGVRENVDEPDPDDP